MGSLSKTLRPAARAVERHPPLRVGGQDADPRRSLSSLRPEPKFGRGLASGLRRVIWIQALAVLFYTCFTFLFDRGGEARGSIEQDYKP